MLGRIVAVLAIIIAQSIVNTALAQSPGYLPSTIDRRAKPTPFQQVKDRWNALSEAEISCVESALRQQNTSIENLMQKGMAPTDPQLAKIRSDCRLTDAEASKKIASLTEQLAAAETEINQLQAEVDRLHKDAQTRAQTRPLRGSIGPAAVAAQKDALHDSILRLIGVVVVVLGILCVMGFFAPEEFKQKVIANRRASGSQL
jgi:predicted phage tail protein